MTKQCIPNILKTIAVIFKNVEMPNYLFCWATIDFLNKNIIIVIWAFGLLEPFNQSGPGLSFIQDKIIQADLRLPDES